MFQKLREDHKISRQTLAEILHLTPGYVLKAEQLSFPSPPAPLVEYWHQTADIPRETLKASYRDAQRHKRHDWLTSWVPIPPPPVGPFNPNTGFCNKWRNKFTPSYAPTQYAVSNGLCVPASAVYFAEKYPAKPVASSILQAVDDLVEYATSGQYYASAFNEAGAGEVVYNLLALQKGLKHDNSNSRVSA